VIDRVKRFADTGNAVRFFLSFILAFALWAWVTNERNPEQTYRASQVPVSAVEIPDSLELVGTISAIDVTLQGPRSVIQSIDAASLTAEIDLSDVNGPGTYRREVTVNVPDGIRSVDAEPEEVTVELDTVVSRSFPIEAIVPSDMPRSLRVSPTMIEPGEATVTGVQRNVDRVAKVLAPVTIDERTESYSELVELVPVDANSVEVENVSVDPGTARIRVEVEVRGKEIPVFVDCECDDVAEGFAVVGQPQANPSNVLIDGPRELLDQVPYIYTAPVSTSGFDRSTVISNHPLDVSSLPEGVTVEPQFVDVSVRVEQTVFTRTLENLPIEVLGAASDTRVVVNPSTLDVEVSGPRSLLDQIEARDVTIVVDVSGLDPGAHQARPRVLLPAQMTYNDALPQVVVAIIENTPTPTPRPAATTTSAPAPTSTP
jgi:YbbR domain-containing protein